VAEIDIINYPANRFVTTDQLEPGRKLVIPFGRKDPIVSQPALDLDYALTWPVAGPVVRDYDDNHQGLDLSSSYGAEVRAAEAGTVYYIGQSQTGYGFTIAIDHGLNRQTLYSHLQAATVQQGEQISRGQVIGSIGSTGDPGGPYVHFELRESGESRNPLLYLNVSGAL
jgi:murein DD-endopeptidase MepM/ murein hydrolase activator NlpD